MSSTALGPGWLRQFLFLLLPPGLAGTWIFLSFYGANADSGLAPGVLILYACALLLVVLAVFGIGAILLPRKFWSPWALLMTAGVVMLFQYGVTASALRAIGFPSTPLQMLVYGALTLAVLAGACWAGRLERAPHAVSIGFAVMVLLAAGQSIIGAFSANVSEVRNIERNDRQAATQDTGQARPSFFSLILDTYASAAVMQNRFEFDNQPFHRALEQRGFEVAEKSYSNYAWTSLSMSSALEMRYLQEPGPSQPYDSLKSARTIMGDNPVVGRLRDLGYSYAMFNPGRYATTISCSGIEDHCLQCGGVLSEAEILLLEKTPFAQLMRRFTPQQYQTLYGQCPISQLGAEAGARLESPVFLLGHHMGMHDPMHVDAGCGPLDSVYPNDWAEKGSAYAGMQIECLNRQVLEMVDSLLQEFDDPIIVIAGDHGFWADGYQDFVPNALAERHSIFTAIRLPERCMPTIPDVVTPVNHYELGLACIENRTPKILEPRFFYTRFLREGDAQSPIEVREIQKEDIEPRE